MRRLLTDAVRLFLWAALLAPAGVLLHELGHFVAARALGFEAARISATSVLHGASIGPSPHWMVALQSGAGPAVTLVLLAIAAWRLRRGPANWAVALAATAPLRFAVDIVYLYFRLMAALQGSPPMNLDFDEYELARALELPPEPIALLAALVLVCTAIWIWREIGRGRRLLLLPLACGAFVGLWLWLRFAGPPITGLINQL